MIRIPQQVMPSSLLCPEDLGYEAKGLKAECSRLGSGASPDQLAQIRKRARALLDTDEDDDCAYLLCCLADLYREGDDADAALDCSQMAEECLPCCTLESQQHNRAVAIYSQGVAYHAQRSARHAVGRYQAALQEFHRARDRWVRTGRDSWRIKCDMASEWIARLKDRLDERRSGPHPPAEDLVDVPVLSRIAAGKPILASEDYEEWVAVAPARAKQAHFALRVVGDSMIGDGIPDGSLVLIWSTEAEPANGEIAAVRIEGRPGEEATLKRFYREPDHVRLEPANASHPVLILHGRAVSGEWLFRQYHRQNPTREIETIQVDNPRIVGWFRGVV